MKGLFTGIVVVAAAMASTSVQAQTFGPQHPILPSPEQIKRYQPPSDLLRARSVSLTVPRAVSRASSTEEIVSLPAEALRGGVQQDAAGSEAGFGQHSAPVMRMELAGVTYELALVKRVVEARSGITHVAMKVIDDPSGYAFLSIDPANRIVGTIATSNGSFAIRPDQDPRTQRVARSAGVTPGTAPAGLEHDVLASSHQRQLQLAQIQPEVAVGSEAGKSLHIRGGHLGTIASATIRNTDLLAALRTQASINYLPVDAHVRITSIREFAGGRSIEFTQVIGAVPVWHRNRMVIGLGGEILEVATQFVDPARRPEGDFIDGRVAAARAKRALEYAFETPMESWSVVRSELYYYDIPGQPALLPRYKLAIKEGAAGLREVLVDAVSGDAEIVDTARPAAGFRVCFDNNGANGAPHPTTCAAQTGVGQAFSRAPDSSTVTCHSRGGGPGSPQQSLCTYYDVKGGEVAIRTAIDALEIVSQTYPSICCTKIGGSDRSIDVVVETSGTTSGLHYDVLNESIMTPSGNLDMRNVEGVWHEFGHHVLRMLNPNVDSLYSVEPFAAAFNEAFADLIHAAIGETGPQTVVDGRYTYGDPWYLGDGYAPFVQRDLYDESFTFVRTTENRSPHERGQAITTFFYKVKQASGISPTRFMGLIAQVGLNMRDFDSNGLDLIDLLGALNLSAGGSETALRSAIDSVFQQMYAPLPGNTTGPLPIAIPPPPGAPGSPVISVTPNGCVNLPAGGVGSNYRVQWAPVAGATSYTAFFKFRNAAYIHDVFTTAQTAADAYTNAPAWVSVSACNSAGCGSTSGQVPISHRPDCGGGP